MSILTPITQSEYDYALECLPPIYPSEYGKEYLTITLEYHLNCTPWSIGLTSIFQNSEPTSHEIFYEGKDTVYKPVYATYLKINGHTYRLSIDLQNLSSIKRPV